MLRSRGEDHVLKDGALIRLRLAARGDGPALLEMWERLSDGSRRARAIHRAGVARETIDAFVTCDPRCHLALLAVLGERERTQIVGFASFNRAVHEPDRAEFFAVVEDAHQGRGIGVALVRRLARLAREAGIQTLTGEFFADNLRMLNLLRDSGLVYLSSEQEVGERRLIRTEFRLERTERLLNLVAAEEKTAARAALDRFFRPRAIAVVGASRDHNSIGGIVFRNLLHSGFPGAVYPVNHSASTVQSVAAYPSLASCPERPDLVMVCVPAAHVGDVIEQAGSLGVRAACVISAGFSEAGAEGRRLQDDLITRARNYGMRIIGPNCMGLLNAAEDVRMNATFSPIFPEPGRLAFSSQSGALGMAVIKHAHELGLGISKFVSVGNKADISGNDILLYCEDDDETDLILLYLESFGNPRNFSRIARRVSRSKPIVVVKSGRTSAGVRAAASHTAALAAGDVAVDALFRQSGVIRTDTLAEMFDVATILTCQPVPAGRRVGILTNAGGPGILAADACESHQLEVPALSAQTRARLREFLPAAAGIVNPVDMIASGTAEQYRMALELLGNAPEVDIVFAIFMPAGTTGVDDVASALVHGRAAIPAGKPIVSVFMAAKGIPPQLAAGRIPSFAFPEDAARALGRIADYASWKTRPIGSIVVHDDLERAGARRLIESRLADATLDRAADLHERRRAGVVPESRSVWLATDDAHRLLRCYGIPVSSSETVSTALEGASAYARIGGTVVVKLAAAIHKSDVGGIRLGLQTADDVRLAIEEMSQRLADAGLDRHAGAFIVQPMVADGVEMAVGVSHDPSFGPIVMAGMGGTLVELLRDVSFRITPLTDVDVGEMIDALKMKPLLTGYRGSAPMDVGALEDLLFRVSAMVEDLPEIAELDLNPVFVRPSGVTCVDVRIKVSEWMAPGSS